MDAIELLYPFVIYN